jgi:RNA polymerase sigma-70 factor (family 1)
MAVNLNDLVELFNNGKASGYKGIFDHYYREIFHFAWKMIGTKEDAEDLTIQVFTKLFQRRNQFTTEANIKAFLYISIRNLCLNFLRDKKRRNIRHEQFVSNMENEQRFLYEYEIKSDILDLVQRAINNLPDTYQRVFRLLILEERKPAEVAELLHISVDTVYQQKKRAIQLLRMRLDDKTLVISCITYILYYLFNKM